MQIIYERKFKNLYWMYRREDILKIFFTIFCDLFAHMFSLENEMTG